MQLAFPCRLRLAPAPATCGTSAAGMLLHQAGALVRGTGAGSRGSPDWDAAGLPFTAVLLDEWGCYYSAGGRLQTGEDARLNDFFAKDDEPLLTGPTK